MIVDSVRLQPGRSEILRGVWLRAERGGVCAIVGRNGSGKSTLMKAIAGAIPLAQGFVEIAGRRYFAGRVLERFRDLAYLPQDPLIPPGFRLADIAPILGADAIEGILASNLGAAPSDRLDSLSLGARRHIDALFTIGLGRDVVLPDEPFHSIDPLLVEQLCALIRAKAAAGTTFIVTDHNLGSIRSVATSVRLVEGANVTPSTTSPTACAI